MSDDASRSVRAVEGFFGGLAKGTMILAAIVVVVLGALGGDIPFTDLPGTRKEWLLFLLFVLLAIAGGTAFLMLRHSPR
ncbi:protein of unknown function [Pararobbsia alpina]|uniref:hypothetical protein n=1 Tax=Pararobbsia alpina TaxID=621374 RepID=UPI0039A42444